MYENYGKYLICICLQELEDAKLETQLKNKDKPVTKLADPQPKMSYEDYYMEFIYYKIP